MSQPVTPTAVIYTRYSPRPNKCKPGGEPMGCESCEAQEELCRAACAVRGFVVIGVHCDRAISGKSREGRPGLMAALDQTKAARATFVAYSLSRWARSTIDAIQIAQELRGARCDLVAVKENIDTASPYGRFFYSVFAALAELEREIIVERTRESMLRHQRSGRRVGAPPTKTPYGYEVDPNDPTRMVPDPDEQIILKRIMAWANEGHGGKWIARQLDIQGVTCRLSNKPMDFRTIRRIIARGRADEVFRRAAGE